MDEQYEFLPWPGPQAQGPCCGSGLAPESQGLALPALVLAAVTPLRGPEVGGTQREAGRQATLGVWWGGVVVAQGTCRGGRKEGGRGSHAGGPQSHRQGRMVQ